MPGRAEFSVSYDRTTTIVSVAACAFLLFVAVAAQSTIAGCVGLVIAVLAYAYSPRGYTVSEEAIVVGRLIGSVRFPLEGVREARRIAADDFRGCIRLWGSGGMFGYYGLFRTSKLGKCRWYVTHRRNAVVVITGAKTALFSPDDVDGFLTAVRAAAPVPEPGDRPPGAVLLLYGARNPVALWIGTGIAGLALAVAALAFLYSPGAPKYTLTAGTLTIHDRFYPVTVTAAGVDAARVRVVDIAVDREWRPTMRINGFANSHYRAGWFRVANGQQVRLYRAGATRLVLIPPKAGGVPILLEVAEPGRFVAEVRRMWAGTSKQPFYTP